MIPPYIEDKRWASHCFKKSCNQRRCSHDSRLASFLVLNLLNVRRWTYLKGSLPSTWQRALPMQPTPLRHVWWSVWSEFCGKGSGVAVAVAVAVGEDEDDEDGDRAARSLKVRIIHAHGSLASTEPASRNELRSAGVTRSRRESSSRALPAPRFCALAKSRARSRRSMNGVDSADARRLRGV